MQAGFTASKVSWLKRHEPDNRARTATILLPYDCINCRFTRVIAAMEASERQGRRGDGPRAENLHVHVRVRACEHLLVCVRPCA